MNQLPFNTAIATALANLVDADRTKPSHSDLDMLFARTKLARADPRRAPEERVGKMKRLRGVLTYALEQDVAAGKQLMQELLGVIAGARGFDKESEFFVGDAAFSSLRAAFAAEGWEVDRDGALRPRVLDALSGAALTSALDAYVKRAQRGSLDAALVTGTGKDLVEATARHVIVERGGSYHETMPFPGTLLNAFLAVGMAPLAPNQLQSITQTLDADPTKRLQQLLYLVATVANTLRNKQGTGHGRPFPPTVSDDDAHAAVEAMGLVAESLLRRL